MATDIPIEELHLPMPWGHIAAKAWGFPNDKRVLAVHGLLDNAGSFDRLIPLLPCGYYFVCIDLPGHGFSSHFPAGMLLDHFQYVLVIRKVLDYLKWEKFIYMGHSLGVLLGLLHSTLYPEGMEKLISFDIDGPVPVPDNELIGRIRHVQNHVLKFEKRQNIKFHTKEELMVIYTKLRYSVLNNAAAEAVMKRAVTKVGDKYKFNRDPRLITGALPYLNDEQHTAILEQFKIPTLIIISTETVEKSNDTPQFAKIDRENEKNRFVIVEGNHDVHNNNPEKVAPYVCQFLGELKSTL